LPGYPRISLPSVTLEETYVLEPERVSDRGIRQVQEQFRVATSDLTGVYGFYVVRVNEGIVYGHLDDETFQAASLIKLPVMAH